MLLHFPSVFLPCSSVLYCGTFCVFLFPNHDNAAKYLNNKRIYVYFSTLEIYHCSDLSFDKVMIIRFTDCSGNGDPIIAPKCEAECNCSGGWEGEFCERLLANGGGDPHLETLDGK